MVSDVQKIEGSRGWWSGMLSIRKSRLVEDDVTGDDHSVGREVKAAVSFVMS
jgi:hypothetical protein